MTADERVRQRIEEDPSRPGPQSARLRESGVPIWAVVSYYDALNHDLEATAHDYDIPVEDVRAALDYYRRHKHMIDARIAMNAA
ncbi:MAG TPA: DUF433 domain-containing protein [Chloroflexota bacterium]